MKLPKLYRVVCLELDYETDHGHHSGYIYVPARLIINEGVKTWQIIDQELALEALYEDEMLPVASEYNFNWVARNHQINKYFDSIRHDPECSRVRRTIAQQKEDAVRVNTPCPF